MISLNIRPEISKRYPELRVSAFVAENLQIAAAGAHAPTLESLWSAAAEALAENNININNLVATPVVQSWRTAMKAVGLIPSTHRSSVEALTRRFLRSGPVHTPFPLVDLYCALSVIYQVPLGAYDIDRLPQPVIDLRFARPHTDTFAPIGGNPSETPCTSNVPVYAAGDVVACWGFNYRDSKATCLTASTSRAVFIGEAVEERHQASLQRGLEALSAAISRLGASTSPLFAASVSSSNDGGAGEPSEVHVRDLDPERVDGKQAPKSK